MTTWVLVIFMKLGYAGGAVEIPQGSSEAWCKSNAEAAKVASKTVEAAFCVRK